MNPFSSDKAPYAIALLISAIGWLFGTLHGGVQNSEILAYRVRETATLSTLRVTNLSKTKAIENVQLSLVCADFTACFAKPPQGNDFARFRRVSPTAAPARFLERGAAHVVFVATLPPGASIEMAARKLPNSSRTEFYYLPRVGGREAIYVMGAANPFAWFVAHYYLIATVTGLLLAMAFVGWLLLGLRKGFAPPKEKKDETPARTADAPASPGG